MDIVVTCEFRFARTPDGQVWTTSAFAYPFWGRYLRVFDSVIVVARIEDVECPQETWRRADGERVQMVALPYYVGLTGMLKHAFTIRRIIRNTATPERGLIYRVPSQSAMLASLFRPRSQAYALEVVGDPYDVFQAGITHSWLDKLLGWVSYAGLNYMASHAVAASYVTRDYLQQRYPVQEGRLSIGCSSIELAKSQFASAPRQFTQGAHKLLFIGSFSQMYKGPDTLIEALAKLKEAGHSYKLTMLGGGSYLRDMQVLAEQKGLAGDIVFAGELPQSEVVRHIDKADVFVMPSRTEGLPRALIEAMARGLPCLASGVGGIPELLDRKYLFEPGSPDGLADKLAALCQSPDALNRAARTNLARAGEYEHSLLEARRSQFYQDYMEIKKQLNESSAFA